MDLVFNTLTPQTGESPAALLARIAYGAKARQVQTLLASASRTANTTTGVIDFRGALGAIFCLNITVASGTGGLRIQWGAVDPVDQVTNEWTFILGTAKTTTGLIQAQIYPGLGTDLTASATPSIPKIITGYARVAVIHGDATPYTYSLSCIELT